MKKDDLLKLEGITEELAEKIANMHAEEVKDLIPRSRFNEVNEAKKNAESLVKERDKQLEDIKKSTGDNEELKKQIEALQTENKTAKAEYEANIKQMKIDNAVESALMAAGARNSQAVKALLKLDGAELLEDGTVKGLVEQIESCKSENDYLFATTEAPKNKATGVTPAGEQGNTPSGITKEQFAKMGYQQRAELFNTNRELYDTLISQ